MPIADEHKVQWLSVGGDDRFRDLFLEIMPLQAGDWMRMDRSFYTTERLTPGRVQRKVFRTARAG